MKLVLHYSNINPLCVRHCKDHSEICVLQYEGCVVYQQLDLLLFLRQWGFQCSALLVQLEELQVILGKLYQLSEGAGLHPRSMTAHILLEVHWLNYLRQRQLSINITLLCSNNVDMAIMTDLNLISRIRRTHKVQNSELTGSL